MYTLSAQLLIAAGGLTLYLVVKRWYKSIGSDAKSIPRAPGGHWLWGHEQDAWAKPNAGFYIDNFEKSGGQVFAMKGGMFSEDILAISDPAALSHMFTKHPYDYPKSAFIRPLVERLMGRSLPWAEGDEHKRQRAALAPVFTHENVKRAEPEVRDASEKLVNLLTEHINSKSTTKTGNDTVEINALDWACRATLQIIGSVGFGQDFELGESEDAKAIIASFHELVNVGMTSAGFIAPLVLRAFPFITDLPVKAIQAQGQVKLIVKRLAGVKVQEKRTMNDGSDMKGKDLLSTLLRMQDVRGNELDEILDQIAMFTLVGHETSAASLNFTLYNLAHNKPAQDRLRQELLAFPSGEPTYDDYLNRLPMLEAVAKESLRIFPPVMHTERVAMKDDVLPLRNSIRDPKTGKEMHNISIKKGQTIHVSHMAINRDKSVWGEDASEFKPERWMSTIPNTNNCEQGATHALPPPTGSTQGWNGTFTFLEGPRICIGLRLALFEYKVILADLIKNFEFLPVEGPDGLIETVFSSTGQPYVIGKKSEGVKIPLRNSIVTLGTAAKGGGTKVISAVVGSAFWVLSGIVADAELKSFGKHSPVVHASAGFDMITARWEVVDRETG
ncbi:hypothetical protein FRB96_001823 [Tulasnella sp. 330]|nr:hypothetical protein FRB96_001823 [Tulasnella sp. 330]KAG8885184.1 hypothetical protein FRB97_002002 [Tulasnella sp. 331]KAG8889992.1 hypothetical protein FRB98_001427 [Tulasnella sp. 332]